MSRSSFYSESSNHHKFSTVKAMNLKFLEKVHLPSTVTCQVSHVMCPMSCVTCHLSHVTCHLSHVTCHSSILFLFILFIYFYKGLKLVDGGSVINGPYLSTSSDIQVFPLNSKHGLTSCYNCPIFLIIIVGPDAYKFRKIKTKTLAFFCG